MTSLRCLAIASEVTNASLEALVTMALDGVPVNAETMAMAYICECSADDVKRIWGVLAESEPEHLDRDWHQAQTYDLVRVLPLKEGRVVMYEPHWELY